MEKTETPKVPKVGSIFAYSWGYDQTNIDFYEVVYVTASGKTIRVNKIDKFHYKPIAGEPYHDAVGPIEGSVAGPVMTKRITEYGAIRLSSYAVAFPWKGKPEYQTASGYGH